MLSGEQAIVRAHAKMSIWQRDKEGRYRAELGGWSLRVSWLPDAAGGRGGFRWEASRHAARAVVSNEIHEEPEDAMLQAERFTEGDC